MGEPGASLTADGKEPVVWERLKGTEAGLGTPGWWEGKPTELPLGRITAHGGGGQERRRRCLGAAGDFI